MIDKKWIFFSFFQFLVANSNSSLSGGSSQCHSLSHVNNNINNDNNDNEGPQWPQRPFKNDSFATRGFQTLFFFYFDSFPKYRPVTTGAVSIISIFQSALVTILPLLAADLGFFGEVHGPHLGLSVYPLPAPVGLRGPLAELRGGWKISSTTDLIIFLNIFPFRQV